MRKVHLCIFLVIISNVLFLSGCQTGQINAPEVLAEFEYSGRTNHISVPVEFQGKEYKFILDTGATKTVFDDLLKDKLGKPFLWPLPFTTSVRLANGRKIKSGLYIAPDASVGPLKLKGSLLIEILNHDLMYGDDIGKEFQGTIGMDFLKKYIVQIDFDNKKVTFFKGKKQFDLFSIFKPIKNKHPEWGEPVPLNTKLLSDSAYYVEGDIIKGIKTDFLIDSGWDGLDVLDDKVLKNINNYIVKEISDSNVQLYNAVSLNDYIIMKKFSVGDLEYKNKLFQNNDYSVLTLDFLSRHTVTFDFPNKIMYLKKGENFNKKPNFAIDLGSVGCVINSATCEVVKVEPDSLTYEKGIMEKDILMKINNRDISQMNITEFLDFLSKPSASQSGNMTWTFKRGEEIFIVEFTKQDLEQNRD